MTRPRSPKTATIAALDASRVPVYMLDGTGRILYVNAAATRALNVRPADLIGHKTQPTGAQDSSVQAAAHRLSPPPQIWQGGSPVRIRLPHPDDHWELEFILLPDADDSVPAILAVGRQDGQAAMDPRLDPQRLREELFDLRRTLAKAFRLHPLIGRSAACRRMRRQVQMAADCEAHVLLTGPRGSGRELLARAIHEARGADATSPLVPLDCSLLDAELLQSTITACLQSCAALETSGVPTLLLLDVDRLERGAQAELLEILAVDELAIRVLATSSLRDEQLLSLRDFLPDLGQTLSELTIIVLPLADRREDIPLLAEHLLTEHADGRSGLEFEVSALEALAAYDWPQGLSELAAAVRASASAATPPAIRFADLPSPIRHACDPQAVARPRPKPVPLDVHLANEEQQQIAQALRRAKGNKARAARLLGISRARLIRRVAHFQLEP